MSKGVTETRVNYLKATWALCQYEGQPSTRDANSQPTVCVALSTHQKVETCNVTPFNSIHKQLFPSQQDLNRLTLNVAATNELSPGRRAADPQLRQHDMHRSHWLLVLWDEQPGANSDPTSRHSFNVTSMRREAKNKASLGPQLSSPAGALSRCTKESVDGQWLPH